jgi:hypothetical protein
MIIIKSDIDSSRVFYSKNIYVILGEVRVLAKVQLTIENGTNIYIVNGPMRSSLIFNTGSILVAKHVYVRACNAINYKPAKCANNGGLWFLGSSANAEKDKITVKYNVNPSSFTAIRIISYYLGRCDPKGGDSPSTDDIDAISVLGVGSNEWNISSIVSFYSGDDGFDVENSAITLQYLRIVEPKEDGINITSSRVNILNSLEITMGKSCKKDRDIFDLEPDEGQTYIRMNTCCEVNISGIFGDQLKLVSSDLPQPNGDKYYTYNNKACKGQTYVYSQKKCKDVKNVKNSKKELIISKLQEPQEPQESKELKESEESEEVKKDKFEFDEIFDDISSIPVIHKFIPIVKNIVQHIEILKNII